MYDYHLGGKDNYEADRVAAEEIVAISPSVRPTVRANRAFLRRVVQYLVSEAGIRQQYVPDTAGPHQIVSSLMAAVPPGSYLAMSDTTRDIEPEQMATGAAKYNARLGPNQFTPRTRDEFAAFFDGLEFIDPGLVPLPQWRALANPAERIPAHAALGRKR